MKRTQNNENLIWNTTNNGRSIFEKELGEISNKCINSPLRIDKNPSFSIFMANNGLWMYKDFSTEDSGTALKFLMKKYNFTYQEAVEYVKKGNFNSGISKISSYNSIKRELEVEFNDISFTKKHHQYWNNYELSEEFVKSKYVYACDKYAINGKVKKVPDDRILFVYFAPDIEQCKFLFLGEKVTKEEKWRSYNIPNTYLWGYSELENTICDKLFVSKSYKDQLVLNYLGYCAISTQNEDAQIMLKSGNVNKINKLSKEIYVGFGSDEQGKNESIKITQATGWYWVNTPNYTLKYGINDFAEYAKEFGINTLHKEIEKRLKKWKNE